MFYIRSKKTDFIDSNGNVVTAYSTNKFTKAWHNMIGTNKEDEEYEANGPLGDLSDHDGMGHNHVDDLTSTTSGSLGTSDANGRNHLNKNNSMSMSGSNNVAQSNDLLLDDERYYDEDGNELNAKMY